jgi:hypothetical protein
MTASTELRSTGFHSFRFELDRKASTSGRPSWPLRWTSHARRPGKWVREWLVLFALSAFLAIVRPGLIWSQSSILDNFPLLNWQPTIAPPGAHYAGNVACARCHPAEARSYLATPMAQALALPEESKVLRANPLLTFRKDSYVYKVVQTQSGSTFTVTDGARSISTPIRWAVGYGVDRVGQTFVFEYGGLFYESQVSYYAKTGGLDITMGHAPKSPEILEEALGFWIDESAVMACLRCHATAATTADHLQVDQMIPGVGCEGCHGPGGQHIEAMQGGNANSPHIFNPGHLPPGRITAFCGACHRTTAQEKVLNLHGVENARFQAYRLESSHCFDPADRRISCIACHNPHQMIEREVNSYDAKCMACHSANVPTARHCPASKRDCVTCHMPKVSIPGAHTMFTDHRIRVVRPNEPYPD